MKTVSGKVVSTKPVSLSKAAIILSKFAASDNGATPAFAAYLKRASASFHELAQLHKKHKTSGGSRHKIKEQHSQSIGSFISEGNLHSVSGVERKKRHGVNKGEGEAGTIDAGLNFDEENRHKSESGEDAGRCNARGSALQTGGRTSEENVDGNLAGSDMGKKSKKKGRTNEIAAVITEEQHMGNHEAINAEELKKCESFDGSKEKKKKREKREREKADAIESLHVNREMRMKKKNDKHEKVISVDANDVKNEIGSVDVSRELRTKNRNDSYEKEKSVDANDVKNEIESFDASKERRTKNKNDMHKKEGSDDKQRIERNEDIKKEMQNHSSSEDANRGAIQIVENDDVHKKRKKYKKKNEIKEERIDEQRDESKGDHGSEIDHVDKGQKKTNKKKRHHNEVETENEGKLDAEETNNKASRKRKHESVGDGEFDGSQEQHKSKKKKK